jgi:glutamine synthetase
VLKKTLKIKEKGFTFYTGPELEYFYFKDSKSTEILDRGGYFDLIPRDEAVDLRRETVLFCEDLGMKIEYSHHEVAPSQHEIDMRYEDALTMADNVMTYRLVVKEVATVSVYATFACRSSGRTVGMHTHMSLQAKCLLRSQRRYHLSEMAMQPSAAPEIRPRSLRP